MLSKLRYDARILTKMTPRRAWNGAKVWSAYQVARMVRKPVQWGLPISISIEPTTACNLRCPECPSGLRQFTRPTGNLKDAFFRKVIDQVAKHSTFLTFYFQGEPYINPNFLNMVSYASGKGLFTATSTNAHFLDDANAKATVESGLDRCIISIDGTTQEVYEQYRKEGELSKVIEGTKNLIRWKKELKSNTPQVVFQFLVVRPNEHQIEEVKKLGKELGVDEVKFKTAQVYDHEDGNELIPLNDKYSRYRKLENGKYQIKNGLSNNCWRLWNACVITWDGKIVPCCFDKDASHQMGNLEQRSFKEIWYNGNYTAFRSKLLDSRKGIDICSNCSEGAKVWA